MSENNTEETAEWFSAEIVCSRPRYIRAGIRFTRGRQRLEGISADRLARLQHDPCLTVRDVTPFTTDSAEGEPVRVAGDDDAAVSDDAINAALDSLLERADPQSFTRSGVPSVRAVSEEAGCPVSKARLDAVWAARRP